MTLPSQVQLSVPVPGRIRVLPPQLVNRIAAGEVVERPASVVKELVENALDAGATRLEIFAGAGGRSIRVADNGHGMTREDAALAFLNHATSKLADDDDLTRLVTLGFRGEALASISAIARVHCLTRRADAPVGIKVSVTAGGEPVLTETGCAPGTVMEVTDLFYNTPARLKFLKRPQTEISHIEEVVQSLALGHPDVRFTLNLNDKTAFETPGTGDILDTVAAVFRLKIQDLREHWIPLDFTDTVAGLTLSGTVASPVADKFHKPSKRAWYPFVNGRAVRCPILLRAIEAGFESLVPHGRYPLGVVFLTMPTEDVDVNVHPTKKEVRYSRPNEVFGFIREGLRRALEDNGYRIYGGPTSLGMESASFGGASFPGSSFSNATRSGGLNAGWQPVQGRLSPSGNTDALDFYTPLSPPTFLNATPSSSASSTSTQPEWKVVGQLFNTYLLLETRQGLMVVDQHIASERACFETIQSSLSADTPQVQQLLASVPLAVTPTQLDLLLTSADLFSRLGFQYQLDTEALQVQLSGVPLIYPERSQAKPEDQFLDLLQQLEATGEMKLDLENMVATLACHTAVRAGDSLTPEQMNAVVRDWLACTLPWTCPHGRPIAHTISAEELNRFFHRPSLPGNAF